MMGLPEIVLSLVSFLARHPSSSPHLTDLELSLLEREAAEGSESADNSYQRGVSLSPTGQVLSKHHSIFVNQFDIF